MRGTIFYKSVQILAYADDINIIARTQGAMKEAFIVIEKAAKKMNLQINEGKTRYMPITQKEHTKGPSFIEVNGYKFEVVCSFTYLGSEVNCKNNASIEVQKRILAANRCFYGLRRHLRSQLICVQLKS
jgi:sorting nexin-29